MPTVENGFPFATQRASIEPTANVIQYEAQRMSGLRVLIHRASAGTIGVPVGRFSGWYRLASPAWGCPGATRKAL
jgi:hypothetical protein